MLRTRTYKTQHMHYKTTVLHYLLWI